MTDSPNVKLVRSIYADWERSDYSSTEWAHPAIEIVIGDGPSPGRWTGLGGMLEGFRDVASVWEDYQTEVDEYRELDGERVLVLVRWSGRGKTSGLDLAQIETKGASLFQVRNAKVTKLVRYFDRSRALADLGLSPEARSADS